MRRRAFGEPWFLSCGLQCTRFISFSFWQVSVWTLNVRGALSLNNTFCWANLIKVFRVYKVLYICFCDGAVPEYAWYYWVFDWNRFQVCLFACAFLYVAVENHWRSCATNMMRGDAQPARDSDFDRFQPGSLRLCTLSRFTQMVFVFSWSKNQRTQESALLKGKNLERSRNVWDDPFILRNCKRTMPQHAGILGRVWSFVSVAKHSWIRHEFFTFMRAWEKGGSQAKEARAKRGRKSRSRVELPKKTFVRGDQV